MKTSLLICIFSIFLNFPTYASSLSLSFPFGSVDKIIKVRDLPDTPQFQLKDGTYYDIGSMYSVKHVLWLGYSFDNSEYVGYIDSQNRYVPLTSEELNRVADLANIQLQLTPGISFFDEYVSRPLLIVILLLSGYFGYRFYIQRKKKTKPSEQEELPSWPHNTIP